MADDGHVIAVPIELIQQSSTPVNPPAGYDRMYFKTDDLLYRLTPAGVETVVGAGGGGSGSKTFAFFMG